jgi:hypothetical protein
MPSVEYPVDSYQTLGISGTWWEPNDSKELVRGQLVWAHVQFFDEIPMQLLPKRSDDRQHGSAILQAVPLRANQKRSEHESLPVTALPRRDGADGFVVNRAKCRPCLILGGAEPTRVSDLDSKGQPNWSVAPFALAAPYYSVDQVGRAGYRPELVEKIRHARFRQLFYEKLPLKTTSESILRFDQAFPLSHQSQSYVATGYRLGPLALAAVDEWFDWYITGILSREGELHEFRECMRAYEMEASA